MILDKENMFSQEQAVTASALSTDIVDLGIGDIGPSESISLFVNAGEAFTGGGSLEVEVLTSDEISDGALSGAETIATYPVTNDQLLAGGKLISARLPHGMKRYARLNFEVSGGLADGKLTAGLVMDSQAGF